MALGRLAHTPCDIELYRLDRVGKKHESKSFEFEISADAVKDSYLLDLICIESLLKSGMADWTSDNHYGLRDSFFEKDGKQYARVTIRRWVDKN